MIAWRSIRAIAAGAAAGMLLSYAADAVLGATGAMGDTLPETGSTGLVAAVLGYRTVFNVVGSWVAARLAPVSPMRHSLFLGGLGLLASVAGAVAGSPFGPGWYSWGLAHLSIPAAWIGGVADRVNHPRIAWLSNEARQATMQRGSTSAER
jgi:hypothetical protein